MAVFGIPPERNWYYMTGMHTLQLWAHELRQVTERHMLARYLAAGSFVLATVAFRAAFQGVFNSGVYYHLYYPAVILSAYLLGAGPGVFATVLSAGLAYGLFGQASVLPAHVPLISFVSASAVAVFVLTHVRTRLSTLTQEYERIDALTRSQAALFRTHAARVSDHLQLISALLQLQARDGVEGELSRVLMNAASRTMLISRIHRTFANEDVVRAGSIDFKAFAMRLAEAALEARGRPPLSVMVEGEAMHLPLEQATSLGLVLLECISARVEANPHGLMHVLLSKRGDQATFRIIETTTGPQPARDMQILGAIAEQMRGSLVLSAGKDAASLNLSFPTALPALPDWAPLQPMH